MQSYFGFLAGEDLVKGPSSFVDLASAQKEFISKVLAPGHLMVLKSVTMTVVVILVQPLSSVQLFKTPMDSSTSGLIVLTISQCLHKFMSIGSGMPSNHLILCRPLLLCLQSFSASKLFQ